MLAYVGVPLAGLFAYDVAIVIAYKGVGWQWVALPHIPLALFGSAIGIILSFRNVSAYDRWWEARKLWGSIVNNTRSWARQVMGIVQGDREAEVRALQHTLIYEQIAWTHATRQHLRGLEPWTEIAPFLTVEQLDQLRVEKNVPLTLQISMSKKIGMARASGLIDNFTWTQLDDTLNDLADAQGGSERIKNTPFPRQYDYFPRLFVHIYCLMLPLALVQNLGWFTPLGSTLVGFIFLAVDRIGRDLEDPFDNKIYDVPLTAISTTIEINLRQSLGESEVPNPIKPVHGVLW